MLILVAFYNQMRVLIKDLTTRKMLFMKIQYLCVFICASEQLNKIKLYRFHYIKWKSKKSCVIAWAEMFLCITKQMCTCTPGWWEVCDLDLYKRCLLCLNWFWGAHVFRKCFVCWEWWKTVKERLCERPYMEMSVACLMQMTNLGHKNNPNSLTLE